MMNDRMSKLKKAGLLVLATLLAGSVFGAPYVVLNNGKRFVGTDIRKMRNGDIKLTMPETGDQLTFTPGQVRVAMADKPKKFDPAIRALDAGKHDLAIKALQEIVDEYGGLQWDVRAMPYLARAYAANEQYSKAVNAFEDMYEENPKLKRNTDLSLAYCEVLLKAGKTATLEQKLDEMIASGDRQAAANAQLMRGNIALEKKNYKDAAKDYLRTVYFFRNIDSVLPEATYKLATALEAMRDKRAEKWYRTVVHNFPNSSYARKAQSKL